MLRETKKMSFRRGKKNKKWLDETIDLEQKQKKMLMGNNDKFFVNRIFSFHCVFIDIGGYNEDILVLDKNCFHWTLIL